MKRLALGLAVFGAYFGFAFIAPSVASVNCVNSQCVSAARSSWLSLLAGPALLLVLVFLPRTPWQASEGSVPFLRRFLGFSVDVTAVGIGLGAVATLPLLLAEAWHTGQFHWAYQRDYARASDWLLMLAVFGLLLAPTWLWRRWQNGRAQPSIGQYVAGYAVVSGKRVRFRYA